MQALIPLALEGTDVGKVKAAHALAKIAAVSNPDIAFPGERVGARCRGGWDGAMGGVFSAPRDLSPCRPTPGLGGGMVPSQRGQ